MNSIEKTHLSATQRRAQVKSLKIAKGFDALRLRGAQGSCALRCELPSLKNAPIRDAEARSASLRWSKARSGALRVRGGWKRLLDAARLTAFFCASDVRRAQV